MITVLVCLAILLVLAEMWLIAELISESLHYRKYGWKRVSSYKTLFARLFLAKTKVVPPPCDIGELLTANFDFGSYWSAGDEVVVEAMFPATHGKFWFVRVRAVDGRFIPSSHAFTYFSKIASVHPA